MPIPMKTPALAGAGAMDQVPMLRAVAARAAIQRRECSEIFLKLSIFGLRAEELRTPRAIWSKYAGSSPRQSPTRSMTPGREGVAVLEGRGPHVGHGRPLTTAPRKTEPTDRH